MDPIQIAIQNMKEMDQGLVLWSLRQTSKQFDPLLNKFIENRRKFLYSIPSTIQVGYHVCTYLYRKTKYKNRVFLYKFNFCLDQLFFYKRINVDPNLIPPVSTNTYK